MRELAGAVERLVQEVRDSTDWLEKQMDRLEKNVTELKSDMTALKSSGVVAVAVLLVVVLGITPPDVWQNGLYGQLLMEVLPGAK